MQGKKNTSGVKFTITLPPYVYSLLEELSEDMQLKKSPIITTALIKYHQSHFENLIRTNKEEKIYE